MQPHLALDSVPVPVNLSANVVSMSERGIPWNTSNHAAKSWQFHSNTEYLNKGKLYQDKGFSPTGRGQSLDARASNLA